MNLSCRTVLLVSLGTVTVLASSCRTNDLVIKDKTSARYLEQLHIPEVGFRDALMSDVAVYIANSMNHIGVTPSIVQQVSDETVTYEIGIRRDTGEPTEPAERFGIEPYGPRVSLSLHNTTMLQLLKSLVSQTKTKGSISNNMFVLITPRGPVEPSHVEGTKQEPEPAPF